MKFPLLLLASLLGCSSCEKVRTLIGKGGEKPPAVAAAPYITGPAVSEISASDFEHFRQQTGKVIIVLFHADWCGQCKQLVPILDQVAASHPGLVLVGMVNVDKSPALVASEGIQGIPDARIFRDGKEVDHFTGLLPEAEVRQRVENHLKEVASPAPKPAEPEELKPAEPEKPKPAAPEKPKPAAPQEPKPAEPEKPKVAAPLIRPMAKDWMPEGMKRR